jgi:hypothetical protein
VSCLDRNASGGVCGALFGVCMYSAGIMRDSYNAIVRFRHASCGISPRAHTLYRGTPVGPSTDTGPRSIFHPNSEPLIPRGPDRHLAESFRIFGQSVDTLRKGRYIGPTLTASGSSGDRKEPSDGTSEKTFPVRP